jgi:AcrR family transcriptional regulator
MAEAGLRERSKARRKAAIIRAAYTLFTERGYDATTVADIAAEADVAPRTVAMYFPSKQDIALSRFSEAMDTLTSALRERGPGETTTEVIKRWLRDMEQHGDHDMGQLERRMFRANPGLHALRTARMTAAIQEGAEAIARDTGTEPGSAGPRIAAVAAAAILIELTDMSHGPDREQATTTALRFLDAGIGTL